MPIEYWVYPERRLVIAKGRGIVTDEDVFGYQRDVSASSEVNAYDELIDMSQVEHIPIPSTERIRELAKLAASGDTHGSNSRLAILATGKLTYALGHIYEIYRRLEKQSTMQVGVFQSLEQALTFLGISGPLDQFPTNDRGKKSAAAM
jgi:hypothetical protein